MANRIIGLLLSLLSISGFVLAVRQGYRLSSQPGVLLRIRKAFLTGFGFLVFFISGVMAIYFFGDPNLEKDWSLASLEGLLCFAIPIGLLTIIGSFIWFSRINTTQQYLSRKLKEITGKSHNKQ